MQSAEKPKYIVEAFLSNVIRNSWLVIEKVN